jgi:hypothetical protein
MIKAIETRYANCRFRSRLEARWAVFFDHLGVKWEYEPEGFDTPAGPYLPDFALLLTNKTPQRRVFFEVKPDYQRHQPFDPRWTHVAEAVDGMYVAYGLPELTRENFHGDYSPTEALSGFVRFWASGAHSALQFFAICPRCRSIDISWCGEILETKTSIWQWDSDQVEWRNIHRDTWWEPRWTRSRKKSPYSHVSPLTSRTEHNRFRCCQQRWTVAEEPYHAYNPLIAAAYTAARSARFEHGERG